MSYQIGEVCTVIARTVVISPCGRLALIGQRSENCRTNGGMWEFLGGKVEFASEETIDSAMVREPNEESGVIIKELNETIMPAVHVHQYNAHGRHHRNITVTGVGRAASTELSLDLAEVANAKWVPLAEIPTYELTVASQVAYGHLALQVATEDFRPAAA